MKVIQNTYPEHPNVPHAKVGDTVHWEHGITFRLIRESDGKTLFSTGNVNRDGLLYSNKKPPILTGVIAHLKNKGWVLEIGEKE